MKKFYNQFSKMNNCFILTEPVSNKGDDSLIYFVENDVLLGTSFLTMDTNWNKYKLQEGEGPWTVFGRGDKKQLFGALLGECFYRDIKIIDIMEF